jgi:hypothetical protein
MGLMGLMGLMSGGSRKIRHRLRWYAWACLCPALFPLGAHGALPLSAEDFRVGGYVDGGRFQISDTGRTGEIVNRVGARWHFEKSLGESWSTSADIHWYFWRNQATDLGLFHIAGQKFNSDMQGWLRYQAGPQSIRFGFFDFKYNPDSKDLGEYLIRSEAYPTILESSQGKDLMAWSNTRVAGVQYGTGGEYLRHMALLYAEQVNEPVNDISAAYFMSAGPRSAELSLGVDYARFLRLGDSLHLTNDLQTVQNAKYVGANGLTTRAWKFILRGRLDLAGLLRIRSPFVLYGEAAILGLKKDTLYYRNLRERMPMMAGMDIPTFGILDVLSFEGEYFPNRYYEKKYQLQENKFTPLPSFVHDEEYSGANLPLIRNHDWRWSANAERSLNRWLSLKLRVASDHMRLLNWSGDYEGGTPFASKSSDWYWLARIEFHD